MIQSQIDASIQEDRPIYAVADTPMGPAAVRTAPVWVGDRLVGATWTMVRLVDPLFVDLSARGYRSSALLALGGVAAAGLLAFNLSMTVRRQAKERVLIQSDLRRGERLAALGKLLTGVAHEVRNPLAGIRSTVQLWKRGIGPDPESIDDLEDEVDRLDAIVSRLLQFSRADALDLIVGDLNAAAAEAARLAAGLAESAGVVVELSRAPFAPPVAMAEPALTQLFRNLTSNAIQAMADGGTLAITTRHDPARRVMEVQVADSGPGLSPEARQHLFEPFFTTKPGGTGLGLAIAREIALAHGGELTARESEGEAGAVFVLTLPVLEKRPET